MPSLRPFRALRFDPSAAPDLARLICPPYDVVSPRLQQALAARDAHNAIHLELPLEYPGEEPEEKYRRAARDLVAWRNSGILRKDRRPAIYVYEQTYVLPGTTSPRTQRGFFARLKLEPFGPGSGVLPHERTLSRPKEDRLRLLRATGVNTSAVMALYAANGETAPWLARLTDRTPDVDVCDDVGVGHRLWVAEAEDPEGADAVRGVLALAGERRVTIADGHHRYETALRYSQERNRGCEEDPPFTYVLCALFDLDEELLTTLPTHRLVRGRPAGDDLIAAARDLFEVQPLPSSDELLTLMAGTEPRQRIGLFTAGRSVLLRPVYRRFEPLLDPGASDTLRRLDVTVLAVALERLLGIDAATASAGERLDYTKDPREAIMRVESGDADAAFLLDPTPVSSVARVAAAGELMPQKSTYFYPKVATGLVFNPLEP